ncbi:hypothetical protein T01_1421 [Trichinella spiralis]|uniref:Uncharacterized protein n=1 Tax=Trichinella spiralis TaxID=6334 RepID=A0A0V1BEG5_TRISP|nr:hypothetical protein T01_1421 [Trichinella spiralis]
MYYFLLLLLITGVNASGSHRSFLDAEYAWLLQNNQAMIEPNARSGDIPESVIVLEPRVVPSNVVPAPPREFQNRAEKETVTHRPDGDFTDAEYKWLLENGKLITEDQVRDDMDIPDSILIRPRRNITEDVIPVPPARYQQREKKMYYFLLLLLITAKDSIGSDRNYTDAEYAWLLKNKKAMLKTNAENVDIPESVILLDPRQVPSNVVPIPPKEFQKKAEKETVTQRPDGDFTDAEYKWLLQNKKLMLEDQVRDDMDIPGSILIRPRRNISEDVVPVPPARYQQRVK